MKKKNGVIKKIFSFFRKKVEDEKIETGRKIEKKIIKVATPVDDIIYEMDTVNDNRSFGISNLVDAAVTGTVVVTVGIVTVVVGIASGGYQVLNWITGSSDKYR